MRIYMKITTDKYELPLALADSAGELARLCGTTKGTVLSAISHTKKNGKKSPWVRVEVDDLC